MKISEFDLQLTECPRIKISKEIRGNRGNWNKVLMLKNSDKTFAESTEEENVEIWNKNFIKIAKFLSGRNEI